MDHKDLAYLGGFFDGEGSIGVYESKSSGAFCLRVQISQRKTDLTEHLLNSLKERYGGSISSVNKQRPGLLWQVSGDKAVRLLRDIRPYLYLKADEADLAVAWQSERPGVQRDERGRILARTPEQVERGRRVVAVLKEAKRR